MYGFIGRYLSEIQIFENLQKNQTIEILRECLHNNTNIEIATDIPVLLMTGFCALGSHKAAFIHLLSVNSLALINNNCNYWQT